MVGPKPTLGLIAPMDRTTITFPSKTSPIDSRTWQSPTGWHHDVGHSRAREAKGEVMSDKLRSRLLESRLEKLDGTTRSILDHWTQIAPDDRLAHLLRDASRGLTRALQLRLSEYGISFGHWAFLRILWAFDGLSQRELSIQAGLKESTTHTALNRMEELGHIERRHNPGNRRKLHVYLTNKGRALEGKLVPLAEDVNRVAVAGLSAAQIEVVREAMLVVIANLALDEAEAVERGQRITPTRDLGRRDKQTTKSGAGAAQGRSSSRHRKR
jgi:MarR family transcriptional regulator, organic hydroperoxide resistance regulator